jgi:hypothetical protein
VRAALLASWLGGGLLAAAPAAAMASAPIELARDGRTSYAIVLARGASPAESLAASELAGYLGRISGAHFDVGAGAGAHRVIVVGIATPSDSLTGDAYAIRVRGDSLLLVGGSGRATLYAAYDLLQRLGCEWLAPGFAFYAGEHEIVPRRATLVYDQAGDVVERPAIATRILDVGQAASYDEATLRQLVAWLPKLRFNAVRFPANHGGSGRVQWDHWRAAIAPELARRGLSIEVGGHGYQNFLNARMDGGALFAQHPEWFGRDSSCRRSRAANVVFNTASQDAERYLLDNVTQYVSARPEIALFDFWPPDVARWADCASDVSLGTPQERQVRLANALQARLRGAHSATRVEIIAYADALLPPATVSLDREVTVDFCPIDQSFDAPIDDAGTANNARYVAALQQWRREHPGPLGLYSYYRKYAWRSLPVMIPHYLQRDLRFYASVPVQRISTYGEPADWFTYELNYLAFGKLAWNPDADVDSLVARYAAARFGPALTEARAALETLERSYRLRASIPFSAQDTPAQLDSAANELMSRLAALPRAGEDLTAGQRANLDRLALMLEMARRDVLIQAARTRGAPAASVAALVEELVRFIGAHASDGVFLSRGHDDDLGRYQRHYSRESIVVVRGGGAT